MRPTFESTTVDKAGRRTNADREARVRFDIQRTTNLVVEGRAVISRDGVTPPSGQDDSAGILEGPSVQYRVPEGAGAAGFEARQAGAGHRRAARPIERTEDGQVARSRERTANQVVDAVRA